MAEDWIHRPFDERYDSGMAAARAARETRTKVAASRAVALAHELAAAGPDDTVREEVTWNVRGEPRTRATFGLPHPMDFPGGLPLPGDR